MPRQADILLSALALVLLAPLMVAIAALVLVTMGRPVFFIQSRVGFLGRHFRMVKFRSLGPDGAPTPLGAVLRRFSLDELPGFWNVLRGDMALVGPRPLIAGDQPDLEKVREERQSMMPGMTGLAQVRGRNAVSFQRSFMLDLVYRRNRSFGLDLYILFLTLPVVVTGLGACALVEPERRRSAGFAARLDRTSP